MARRTAQLSRRNRPTGTGSLGNILAALGFSGRHPGGTSGISWDPGMGPRGWAVLGWESAPALEGKAGPVPSFPHPHSDTQGCSCRRRVPTVTLTLLDPPAHPPPSSSRRSQELKSQPVPPLLQTCCEPSCSQNRNSALKQHSPQLKVFNPATSFASFLPLLSTLIIPAVPHADPQTPVPGTCTLKQHSRRF